MSDVASAAYAVKNGLYQAAKTLFASDDIIVSFGLPSDFSSPDQVYVGAMRTEQVNGPMGGRRARNEDIFITVEFDFMRAGEAEDDKVVTDAAMSAVRRLEEYVRVTDTTLGGVCDWCFAESIDSEGVTPLQVVAAGRQSVISVVFHAFVRITS
jgi:hypothetical protein